MGATEDETRAARRRSRRGIDPVTVAVVLGVVVAAAGAVTYVVLSAFSPPSTATTQEQSCQPVSAASCSGPTNTTGISTPGGVAIPASRG